MSSSRTVALESLPCCCFSSSSFPSSHETPHSVLLLPEHGTLREAQVQLERQVRRGARQRTQTSPPHAPPNSGQATSNTSNTKPSSTCTFGARLTGWCLSRGELAPNHSRLREPALPALFADYYGRNHTPYSSHSIA